MKKNSKFPIRTCLLLFFLAFLVIVFTGNQREKIMTYNMNKVKSIEAVHIVNKYSALKTDQKVVTYPTFAEAIQNGSSQPVAFNGTLTGYGPDCVGCGGRSGCPPRQDFRNGNIYFNDVQYGKIRVVASDRAIPCGSIVRISNLPSSISTEPIVAVVLDRGGAIVENKMDLLYASEAETNVVGKRKDIHFEIIRWGW